MIMKQEQLVATSARNIILLSLIAVIPPKVFKTFLITPNFGRVKKPVKNRATFRRGRATVVHAYSPVTAL